RPPVRYDGGADHHHADQRPPVPRQDLRLGDHVRGRRAGNGRHLRTAELTPEVPRTADNSRRGIHVNAPLYSFSTLPGGPVSSLRERASPPFPRGDRKSTRLNSSHVKTSYAVFCLKN